MNNITRRHNPKDSHHWIELIQAGVWKRMKNTEYMLLSINNNETVESKETNV